MFSPYMRRILIDILLGISAIFGLLYFGLFYNLYEEQSFFYFFISRFHFFMLGNVPLNISTIVYCIQRCLLLILPLIMLTTIHPRKNFNKSNILKTLFISIGVCYFLANSWIIYFMIEKGISPVLNASIPAIFTSGTLRESIIEATDACYQFQYNDGHVFNTIIWNSYDLWGIVFSFIQGFLYINLAMNLKNHRQVFFTKYIIITVISIALPMLYTALMAANHINTPSYSVISWSGRNLFLFFQSFFICIALKIASTSKAFWSDILF